MQLANPKITINSWGSGSGSGFTSADANPYSSIVFNRYVPTVLTGTSCLCLLNGMYNLQEESLFCSECRGSFHPIEMFMNDTQLELLYLKMYFCW